MQVPNDIQFEDDIIVFALDFHPRQEILATSDISGRVTIWRYSTEKNKRLYSFQQHTESCRDITFSDDGRKFYSVSADRSIKCVECNRATLDWTIAGAHDAPVNALLTLDENTIATGDDEGYVKVWDVRTRNEIVCFDEHADYISDFDYNNTTNSLLASSGDGCVSLYDLRTNKPLEVTEPREDDIMSVLEMKNGTRVVCGTAQGNLLVYARDRLEEPVDNFQAHPGSIDCMLYINENTVVTGCMDGVIRIIRIKPNSVSGILGDHQDNPIEALALSCDGRYVASVGHDFVIRFWDSTPLFRSLFKNVHDNDAADELTEASAMASTSSAMETESQPQPAAPISHNPLSYTDPAAVLGGAASGVGASSSASVTSSMNSFQFFTTASTSSASSSTSTASTSTSGGSKKNKNKRIQNTQHHRFFADL